MIKAKVLIVEDEAVIAFNLKALLENAGYSVAGIASHGEKAVKIALDIKPDLILMDISLGEGMNGIETAEIITSKLDIPIVYLTALADDDTLQRAKVTGPFGYILKPFEEQSLYTSIEIALYKASIDKKLKERERWFSTTLKSIGDAVIATDACGNVNFMNPEAEKLTRWDQERAAGKPVEEVFIVKCEACDGMQSLQESPVAAILKHGKTVCMPNLAILKARDGSEVSIDYNCTQIIGDKGELLGTVLVFRDITERRRADKALHDSEEKFRILSEASTDAIFIETLDGKVLYCNTTTCNMFGYSKDRIINSYANGLVPEEAIPARKKMVEDALSSDGVLAESICKKVNGLTFPAEISMRPAKIGGEQLLISYVRDITTRKVAGRKAKGIPLKV